jgi:hypothetical protein
VSSVFISGKFLVSDSQFRQLPDFGNFGDLFPPRPAFFSFGNYPLTSSRRFDILFP